MKDLLRRSGWIFLASVFALTSLGIVIASFVFQPDPSDTSLNSQTCQIEQVASQEIVTAPAEFKVENDVTQLRTEDIQKGSGETVNQGDCITVKYHGTLAKTGEKFDGNFDTPTALKMRIGVGQVIPGWDQGLIGMKQGGTRRLIIPSELAYGSQSAGSIPPNSDLVFVVKVLKVE